MTKYKITAYHVFVTHARSCSTFLLHASRRVVLAFSLDGHLYPIGALFMATTISDHWGLLNTLNGIPIAHTHVQSVGEKS